MHFSHSLEQKQQTQRDQILISLDVFFEAWVFSSSPRGDGLFMQVRIVAEFVGLAQNNAAVFLAVLGRGFKRDGVVALDDEIVRRGRRYVFVGEEAATWKYLDAANSIRGASTSLRLILALSFRVPVCLGR